MKLIVLVFTISIMVMVVVVVVVVVVRVLAPVFGCLNLDIKLCQEKYLR